MNVWHAVLVVQHPVDDGYGSHCEPFHPQQASKQPGGAISDSLRSPTAVAGRSVPIDACFAAMDGKV